MKILIENVDIVTLSEEKVISNGCICIDGKCITYVGKEKPDFAPDTVIDGSNKLAIPGLINAHTHSPMTILRSYADDLKLQDWLFNYIFPIEAKMSDDDVYWGTMLGIAEMIKSGTTCMADLYYYMDSIANAVLDTGIRACIATSCADAIGDTGAPKRWLQENVDLYNKYNMKDDGLITVFVGAHSPYLCSPEYLKKCFETAKELNTGLHIHLAETKTEIDTIIERYGKTPMEHCYSIGVLDDTVLAAHCVHPNTNEIEIMKETGINVVHNPTSNLKLASGVAPIKEYLENDINVAIGTDGASSNNNLNMFEEMHLTGILHKGINYDATLVDAYEVLKMGTVNGAKALGLKNLGKIQEGYRADIVLLDLDKPHFYPKHSMVSNIVYSAQGSDVDTVIVNGEILLKNGEYTTIDFEKIKFNVDRIYKRLF